MGYFTGIMDVYFAPFAALAEDTVTAGPTYDEPEVLGKAIEVTITPGYKEGKLYASNATVRNIRQVDSYTVSINADKISPAVLKALLGRGEDSNDVQFITGKDKPTDVALGLAYTMDDDTKELWWLYKGSFSEPVKTGKTEADNIEYQTPTIEGTFLRRIYDDQLAAVVDTATVGLAPAIVTDWFSEVYETA